MGIGPRAPCLRDKFECHITKRHELEMKTMVKSSVIIMILESFYIKSIRILTQYKMMDERSCKVCTVSQSSTCNVTGTSVPSLDVNNLWSAYTYISMCIHSRYQDATQTYAGTTNKLDGPLKVILLPIILK